MASFKIRKSHVILRRGHGKKHFQNILAFNRRHQGRAYELSYPHFSYPVIVKMAVPRAKIRTQGVRFSPCLVLKIRRYERKLSLRAENYLLALKLYGPIFSKNY